MCFSMKIYRGTTRIVILIASIAIKMPDFTRIFHRKGWFFFLKGILQNEEERKTWQLARYTDIYNNQYHLLCPVKWCSWGGWILIMERAEPIYSDQWKEWIDKYGEIMFFPWKDIGLDRDCTKSNFGILEDRLVKVDYGI